MTRGARVGAPRASTQFGVRTRRNESEPGDTVWTAAVAMLPLLVLLVSIPGGLIEDNGGTVIGDVFAMWNLFGIFGLVVSGPVMIVSLLGAALLTRRFWLGRWYATIGSAAAVLFHSVLVFGTVSEVVSPPQWRDPNSWGPVLTPLSASIVALPYVAGIVAGGYVIIRLWSRRSTTACTRCPADTSE